MSVVITQTARRERVRRALLEVPEGEVPQQLDLPPNPGQRYYCPPGYEGFWVADKLRARRYLIAHCTHREDAEQICDGLNARAT